ncbi:hypothetical protein BYT27DRAFT_7101045 [Phlegmacium glaucopus]|nr:hypothetical protein BYT27DRAFT_7101045 [Phlegmacium glaucopus]
MFEYESSDNAMSKDGLFLERLDTFMDKCLIDIKAFAERELRPYEETRRCIAQWHAKYLFQSSKSSSSSSTVVLVRDVLCDTSRVLESLSEVSGVQSFLLAVDPSETSDSGFLGGSVVGREFWRGLRSGGEGGARAFKVFSINHLQPATRHPVHVPKSSTPPPKGGPAKSLKNELYESVRNALRLASGVRSAEMKWTNPERLDVYGVRLIGWPEGVPAQNPSTFKVSQNKVLLEALQNGSMRFEKITPGNPKQSGHGDGVEEASEAEKDDPVEDFSWAYDADASPPPSHAEYSTTLPLRQSLNTGQNPVLPVLPESSNMSWTPTLNTDSALSQYTLWAGDFNEPTIDHPGWDDELESDSRPRKRPRSEEPNPS